MPNDNPTPLEVTILLNTLTPSQLKLTVATLQATHYVPNEAIPMNQVAQLVEWANTAQRLPELLTTIEKVRTFQITPERVFVVPSPRNPYFTGRDEVLTALHNALTQDHTAALTQAIQGLGGVGKTQTALEYCYLHREDYAYILWTGASDTTTLDSGYRLMAETLNLGVTAESKPEEVHNLMQRWFAGKGGWLLVLDNADDPGLVVPYLPKTDTGRILITSRDSELDCLGVTTPHKLEVMSPGEALGFLLERTGRTETVTEEEQRAAEQLGEALGYLPLALEQAGAYLLATDVSFALYLESFVQQKLALLEQAKPEWGEAEKTVVVTWDISIQKVRDESMEAEELLKVCAFLSSEDIPEETFTMGGPHLGPILAPFMVKIYENPQHCAPMLATATRYSLVQRDRATFTLSMHRLLQEVVRTSLPEADQRDYAERGVEAVNAITPDGEFEEWAICRRLLPVQRACFQNIVSWNIETENAAHLLNQMGQFLDSQGDYPSALSLSQKALAVFEKVLGAEHPSTATSLNNLAVLYYHMGDYSSAMPLYERALAVREQVLGAEHPATAQSLNNLAALYENMGDYASAMPLYERALETQEKLLGAEHPATANSLNNLAVLYYHMGDYASALPLSERALAIFEKVLGEEHPLTANSLHNLATLYQNIGDYSSALPLFQHALAVREKVLGAEHPDTAGSLNNLAVLHYVQGNHAASVPLLLRTLAIWEKTLGTAHPLTATCYGNLAALYQEMGDAGKAREYERKKQEARQAHEERNR